VDTNGLPVHLALTPGEAHDNRLCSVLLGALLPKTMLLADRGYGGAAWLPGRSARRTAEGLEGQSGGRDHIGPHQPATAAAANASQGHPRPIDLIEDMRDAAVQHSLLASPVIFTTEREEPERREKTPEIHKRPQHAALDTQAASRAGAPRAGGCRYRSHVDRKLSFANAVSARIDAQSLRR
jgi:hypothetical protein